MKAIRSFLLLSAALALLAGGCAADKHDVTTAQPGQVTVCTKCYDQVSKVRSAGGPRGGLATNRTITTHLCDDCKNEMTIYSKDGVLMVRCPTCAPEGVDCDRCVPRAAAK